MGFVRPEACVRAQLGLAQAHGAELRLGENILSVRSLGDGVEVGTERGNLSGGDGHRRARGVAAGRVSRNSSRC